MGPFVYFVPFEVCVIVRIRELVSFVQLVEKELTIMIVVTTPRFIVVIGTVFRRIAAT